MSDNIVDFAGTRERRTEDAAKRDLQDWLPEVQKEVRDRWGGTSENSDDPVTLEDLAELALERFEKAEEAPMRCVAHQGDHRRHGSGAAGAHRQ